MVQRTVKINYKSIKKNSKNSKGKDAQHTRQAQEESGQQITKNKE